jgi:hypothetical protein
VRQPGPRLSVKIDREKRMKERKKEKETHENGGLSS